MDPSSPPEVELAVPPGQVEIGCLLLKAIYHPRLDLTTCSSEQLGQLVQLADRYEVSHVVGATSLALSDRITAKDWTAVVAVYQLSESTLKLPECGAAAEAALKLLLEELGDLELAWDTKQKQQHKQLLGLPFQGLKQLLQHQETKVASEDTVLYTIQAWVTYKSNAATEQEQQELAQTIRVAHCSPLCVGTVMPCCPWLVQAWGVQDLMAASLLASKPNQKIITCITNVKELMTRRPAWALAKRPVSAVTTMELTWAVPVSKVKELAAAAASANKVQTLYSNLEKVGTAWSGTSYSLVLSVCSKVGIGLYLRPMFPCKVAGSYAHTIVGCSLGVVNTMGRLSSPSGEAPSVFEIDVLGRGHNDCCSIKGWSSPEELEQRLIAASLLHPDRCLHLRAVVTSPLIPPRCFS